GIITTIALWDGSELRHYVHGENLRDFQDDIFDYSLLITWNGSSFDLPFIEHWFQIHLTHAHIDLRHIMASLGYRGGLKVVEREFEIDRGVLDGVDGYAAILLWKDYMRNGDSKSLETLLAYNSYDVVNLERLMVESYNKKIEETPFAFVNELVLPSLPDDFGVKPHEESLETVRQTLSAREDYLRDLARHLLGR
ncbi:MAG: ribonuclease H-like domain-containing protein, partial [Candidatus Kapaibacterium sp.]